MNKWRTTAAETAFASELVQLRIEAGLNQQALAEAVGNVQARRRCGAATA